jgi:hypothetical protein
MAANKILKFGPVALTGTLATTVISPKITTLTGGAGFTQTQPYVIIRHIRIVNTTAGALAVSLFVGAAATAAAGTEFAFSAYSVSANSYVEWYGAQRLDGNVDFLCGGSTTTGLTLNAEGEIGIV